MAVKYGALLTQIQLDLEMEQYLRTEFTQISLVKNYILNFVNVARFTVYIFSVTLSKDTCSNKLGLSKSPESSLGIFLCYRPLNIVFIIVLS
jgi:hypothetical protein